jgi:hypothetical protein
MVDKTLLEIQDVFVKKIHSELLKYCEKDKTIKRKDIICVLSYVRIDGKKNINKIISILSDLGMVKQVNRDIIQVMDEEQK